MINVLGGFKNFNRELVLKSHTGRLGYVINRYSQTIAQSMYNFLLSFRKCDFFVKKVYVIAVIFLALDFINGDKFPCSREYDMERKLYPSCVPLKCGRTLSDNSEIVRPWIEKILAQTEDIYVGTEKAILAILDVYTGKMLQNNYVGLVETKKLERLQSLISEIVPGVMQTISSDYNITGIGLTGPLLLSRISGQNSFHDQGQDYTIPHVDLDSYEVKFNLKKVCHHFKFKFDNTMVSKIR